MDESRSPRQQQSPDVDHFRDDTTAGELTRSEERFRLLVEAVEDYALVMLDPHGYVLCWNVGATRQTGYDADEMLGQHVARLYAEGLRQAARPEGQLKAAADTGRWEGEVSQRRKNGTIFVAHVVITAIRNDSGTLMAFSNVTQDMTHRKETQDELRANAHRYRALADSVPSLIFTTRPDGTCDYVNRRFAEYTGLSPNSTEGCEWERLLHRDDVDEHRARWAAARQTGTPYENQYRLKNREGIYRWFLVRVTPENEDTGTILKWNGSCTDIEDLRLAEERVHLAQLEAHAAFWQWDLAQNVITWSREYHELCGLDELVRPSYEQWLATVHPDDRASADRTVKHAVAGATDLALEFRICHPTKGIRWLLSVAKTMCDSSRRAYRIVGMTLDVTDRKGAEEEIHRLNQTLTKQLTELQDKIEQLEGFEEVVVGRELKMIALEKTTEKLQLEIERLKALD
jgi:PAS domain S-box-containing protein